MSNTAPNEAAVPDNTPVAAAARGGEPDRYLAALLSPPVPREALVALAAFSAELSAILQRVVHEPAMGEIRLQWWRDALVMPPPLRTGHPVADAIRKAASRHALSDALLQEMIDARAILLFETSVITEESLRDFLWKTEGALFALGAHIVGLPGLPDVRAGCAAAGEAYGLVRLLLHLPRSLAQGRVSLAKVQLDAAGLTADELLSGVADARVVKLLEGCAAQIQHNLGLARQFTANLPRSQRVAFLPLALVEPYLRVLERSGRALLREERHVVPFTRVSRMAAAQLFGRI